MNINSETVREGVKNYYGDRLHSSSDLQTNACCAVGSIPAFLKAYIRDVHPEVSSKYYGCGLLAPAELKGRVILDLGSGSGRDCYLLSRMVGENGHVIGVDMTDQQLEIANKHIEYHTKLYGYKKPNVEFRKGYIEDLQTANIENDSIDVIISNCVVNLSTNKVAVLKECFRVLKAGGEMYFSDVYSDRRIDEKLREDPVLYGECLSGALYVNDFIRVARKAGFNDPRVVKSSEIKIGNKEIEGKIGHVNFTSITYRLFKIASLEDVCEDYGQAVRYKGTINGCPNVFTLDAGHSFEKGRIYPVCGNTHFLLSKTRFKDHFDYFGDMSVHYGLFKSCVTTNSTAGEGNVPCLEASSSCSGS